MSRVVFFSLVLSVTGTASADVLCPRVTSEHNADVSDLRRFRQFHAWRDKKDQDLAIAMWQYLCDRETGLYHMSTVNDGTDPWSEYSTVRDPIKLMNIYNVGYCGIFGPVLDGVFQGAGFEKGRSFGVSKWNHCTTEVWYGGAWHYLDLDVRGGLMKPNGVIASLAEARASRDLWVDPRRRVEPFFPKDHDKGKVFELYRDSSIDNFYRWFQSGHTMDFRLRQGESLTRWWHPRGKRWHHLKEYNKGFVRKLLEKDPPGYKSNHPNFSVWTQGNGLWLYEPDLSDASNDFADGAHAARNVEPAEDGLRLSEDGVGEVVFEVFTPWIIVPEVNDLDDENDDSGASVLTIDAARPIDILVSLDHGKSWTGASTARGETAVDLTEHVKGSYGFLVRLRAQGKRHDAVLRSLRIETWVQVAPMSLPRLKRGVNRCRYDLGDRHGKRTRTAFVAPNTADPKDLKKYVIELPDDYDPARKTARIRGDVVLALEAPEGTLIDWFTAGACFQTHQNQGAESTDNRIAFATGEPRGFREIYRAEVPTWVNHWRYQWDQDVVLDAPAKKAFVKYSGNPGLNVLRATVHLKPERKPDAAIRITHAFELGERLVEHVVDRKAPGGYTVSVDGEPKNVFVRMAVPSRKVRSEEKAPARGRTAKKEPEWIQPMRRVHARSRGEKGALIHLGDSISYTLAYFAPLQYARDAKMSASTREALTLVDSYMKKDCYRWKGPDKGNYSGQTAAWGLKNADRWIDTLKPEVALIMFGTNDIRRGSVEKHEKDLRALVRKCLDRGVVVILSTIPPMHGFDEKVLSAVEAQRRVAADLKVPLIDLYAHVLRRRPDDWNGQLKQFEKFGQYEVPTIISKDGVHPSNPKEWQNDYTEIGLSRNGNVLRSYLSLRAYAEVIDVVLKGRAPGDATRTILGAEPPKPSAARGEARKTTGLPAPARDWHPVAPPLPKPRGEVIDVGTVDQLYAAVSNVKRSGTISLADGLYKMPRTLTITTDGVTLRSRSGRREKVVLDFASSRHHEGLAVSHSTGVTIADLTVENVRQNGIKINSNHGVDRVTIYNVVSHNVWQRHIKGPGIPDENGKASYVEDCRVQYCLFYNDRPKRRGDEPWEDESPSMGFNYIGGLDIMRARGWVISDNVFTGIRGATGEGRGAIFLWQGSRSCVIERNVIVDCDTGICMGNSSGRGERRHAVSFIVRNNFVTRCSENNILAVHTRDCRVLNNTVHDPRSRNGRLLRAIHANDGLVVTNNIFSGPRIVVQNSEGSITVENNLVRSVGDYFVDAGSGNLHLTTRAIDAIDKASAHPSVGEDFDGRARGDEPDLGADELDR